MLMIEAQLRRLRIYSNQTCIAKSKLQASLGNDHKTHVKFKICLKLYSNNFGRIHGIHEHDECKTALHVVLHVSTVMVSTFFEGYARLAKELVSVCFDKNGIVCIYNLYVVVCHIVCCL